MRKTSHLHFRTFSSTLFSIAVQTSFWFIALFYNFTKTQHDYETYFDNFIDRGRRCKYCHSARPEDFAEAFADKIKDVSLTIGKSKRDKYFAYTCVICNSKYSDTVSNMKKSLCDNPTRNICKKKRCVKKGKRIKELTLAMSQLYN